MKKVTMSYINEVIEYGSDEIYNSRDEDEGHKYLLNIHNGIHLSTSGLEKMKKFVENVISLRQIIPHVNLP